MRQHGKKSLSEDEAFAVAEKEFIGKIRALARYDYRMCTLD